jgi:hypothetical protein
MAAIPAKHYTPKPAGGTDLRKRSVLLGSHIKSFLFLRLGIRDLVGRTWF